MIPGNDAPQSLKYVSRYYHNTILDEPEKSQNTQYITIINDFMILCTISSWYHPNQYLNVIIIIPSTIQSQLSVYLWISNGGYRKVHVSRARWCAKFYNTTRWYRNTIHETSWNLIYVITKVFRKPTVQPKIDDIITISSTIDHR